MEKKLVVIINGRSGVGKATLVGIASEQFMTRDVSSIERVKKIARDVGWNGVKDLPGRQLLSDLKQALVTYDDSPHKDLIEEFKKFMTGGEQLMFVHIREPKEIQKFVSEIKGKGAKVVTLLVKRKKAYKVNLMQDEELEKFAYDLVFDNDKTIKDSGTEFCRLLHGVLDSKN